MYIGTVVYKSCNNIQVIISQGFGCDIQFHIICYFMVMMFQ